jgi:NAD(P)-dependent dehydrogenase (short-subunit alcohol dehydrogenase family)
MSKFALESMADTLRVELAPFRILVALIEPGSIATPIWTKPQTALDDVPPERVALYADRLGKFRELAAARMTKGVPADVVAQAVEHALTSPKPHTRYVVGPDARRRARVERLPDRLRDRVLTRYLFGSETSR